MDKLQKIASKYQTVLQKYYYFEIARKQKKLCFVLSFNKSEFYHLAGLHKLTDIAALQREPNKGKVFDSILNGKISYSLLEHSRFFPQISARLELLGNLENILDSNQIMFRYVSDRNQMSRIEADFLLENAYDRNIVFMFLCEKNMHATLKVPNMCCRSFFPMEEFDYTRNQPSYTLLKKEKIDIITGARTVQYDRSEIMDRIKKASSEPERKSLTQQLNEKKAQQAINNVLAERKSIKKDKQDSERF